MPPFKASPDLPPPKPSSRPKRSNNKSSTLSKPSPQPNGRPLHAEPSTLPPSSSASRVDSASTTSNPTPTTTTKKKPNPPRKRQPKPAPSEGRISPNPLSLSTEKPEDDGELHGAVPGKYRAGNALEGDQVAADGVSKKTKKKKKPKKKPQKPEEHEEGEGDDSAGEHDGYDGKGIADKGKSRQKSCISDSFPSTSTGTSSSYSSRHQLLNASPAPSTSFLSAPFPSSSSDLPKSTASSFMTSSSKFFNLYTPASFSSPSTSLVQAWNGGRDYIFNKPSSSSPSALNRAHIDTESDSSSDSEYEAMLRKHQLAENEGRKAKAKKDKDRELIKAKVEKARKLKEGRDRAATEAKEWREKEKEAQDRARAESAAAKTESSKVVEEREAAEQIVKGSKKKKKPAGQSRKEPGQLASSLSPIRPTSSTITPPSLSITHPTPSKRKSKSKLSSELTTEPAPEPSILASPLPIPLTSSTSAIPNPTQSVQPCPSPPSPPNSSRPSTPSDLIVSRPTSSPAAESSPSKRNIYEIAETLRKENLTHQQAEEARQFEQLRRKKLELPPPTRGLGSLPKGQVKGTGGTTVEVVYPSTVTVPSTIPWAPPALSHQLPSKPSFSADHPPPPPAFVPQVSSHPHFSFHTTSPSALPASASQPTAHHTNSPRIVLPPRPADPSSFAPGFAPQSSLRRIQSPSLPSSLPPAPQTESTQPSPDRPPPSESSSLFRQIPTPNVSLPTFSSKQSSTVSKGKCPETSQPHPDPLFTRQTARRASDNSADRPRPTLFEKRFGSIDGGLPSAEGGQVGDVLEEEDIAESEDPRPMVKTSSGTGSSRRASVSGALRRPVPIPRESGYSSVESEPKHRPASTSPRSDPRSLPNRANFPLLSTQLRRQPQPPHQPQQPHEKRSALPTQTHPRPNKHRPHPPSLPPGPPPPNRAFVPPTNMPIPVLPPAPLPPSPPLAICSPAPLRAPPDMDRLNASFGVGGMVNDELQTAVDDSVEGSILKKPSPEVVMTANASRRKEGGEQQQYLLHHQHQQQQQRPRVLPEVVPTALASSMPPASPPPRRPLRIVSPEERKTPLPPPPATSSHTSPSNFRSSSLPPPPAHLPPHPASSHSPHQPTYAPHLTNGQYPSRPPQQTTAYHPTFPPPLQHASSSRQPNRQPLPPPPSALGYAPSAQASHYRPQHTTPPFQPQHAPYTNSNPPVHSSSNIHHPQPPLQQHPAWRPPPTQYARIDGGGGQQLNGNHPHPPPQHRYQQQHSRGFTSSCYVRLQNWSPHRSTLINLDSLRTIAEVRFGPIASLSLSPNGTAAFITFARVSSALDAFKATLPVEDGGEGGVSWGDQRWFSFEPRSGEVEAIWGGEDGKEAIWQREVDSSGEAKERRDRKGQKGVSGGVGEGETVVGLVEMEEMKMEWHARGKRDFLESVEENAVLWRNGTDPAKDRKKYECPICFEILVEPHMFAPCAHTLCIKCTNNVRAEPAAKCPCCRTRIEATYPNRSVEELVLDFVSRSVAINGLE